MFRASLTFLLASAAACNGASDATGGGGTGTGADDSGGGAIGAGGMGGAGGTAGAGGEGAGGQPPSLESCGQLRLETVLRTSDSAPGQFVGWALDADGDTLLAGVPRDSNINGTEAGAAYVFRRAGGEWTEAAKLLAPSPGSDAFGDPIAISAGTALIGQGRSIFLADENATVWSLAGDFDGRESAAFGLSGNRAIVGMPPHPGPTDCSYEGEATVLHRVGDVWQEEAVFGAGSTCSFGGKVAISGDTATVYEVGVHVFVREPSGWSEQAFLIPEGVYAERMDLDGNTLVLGSPSSGAIVESGAVAVFHRDGTTWSQEATLAPPEPTDFGYFGWSVSVLGACAIVGSPVSTLSSMLQPRSAYAYERAADGTWSLVASFESGQTSWNAFGYSVVQTRDWVAIGNIGGGPTGNEGEVWIYRRTSR